MSLLSVRWRTHGALAELSSIGNSVAPGAGLIIPRLRQVAVRWEAEFLRLRRAQLVRFNRAAIAAVLLTVVSSWRVSAAPPALPAALQACAQERDDSQRLACYDREVPRLDTTPDKAFGLSAQQQSKLEQPDVREKPKPQTLSSSVTAVSQRVDGRIVVALANGQIWVQGEAWKAFPLNVGDAITIKPGALGSFQLDTPSGVSIWVTRAR